MAEPKILYAVQGTGNGHVARAREVIPILQKFAEVDVLISGNQSEIELPLKPKYAFRGITMVYNNSGGVSNLKTLFANNLLHVLRDINTLPVQAYDLVISDFEPISSWACKLKKRTCVALSHQAALVSKFAPRPSRKSKIGQWVIDYYAPTSHKVGFHFKQYDHFIFTPIIRSEIRALTPQEPIADLYAVYLPAFSSEHLSKTLQVFYKYKFVVFGKDVRAARKEGNIQVEPIENTKFIETLKACQGVITGAGFETPSEVLYLKKKLLVIPIAKQYEQLMNAKALEDMGVPVLYDLEKENLEKLKNWLQSEATLKVDFPDETEEIIKTKILPLAVKIG